MGPNQHVRTVGRDTRPWWHRSPIAMKNTSPSHKAQSMTPVVATMHAMASILACFGLLSPLGASQPLLAQTLGNEAWVNCSYNGRNLRCRRTFLCSSAPCNRFRLTWSDGISDTYTLIRTTTRTSSIYRDPRGGEWNLLSYAGSFVLRNPANGNTIIFDGSQQDCSKVWQLGSICG